jgi:hypothetical protein
MILHPAKLLNRTIDIQNETKFNDYSMGKSARQRFA